jgi:3'-5' exoribonuclease
MTRSKPPLVRLAELSPGERGDFFALLIERTRGARRDGKPFYTCRFRDNTRVVTAMVWEDGGWFRPCEESWQEGQFYKIRGKYDEHKTYGGQIEIDNIRPVADADRADGFDPLCFVERTRFDPEVMFAELCALVDTEIADVPLRKLVRTLLDQNAPQLKQVPATQRHFHPFAGGLLEHTLSVTHTCLWLADRYAAHYGDLKPPLNRDLVIAGAVLHDIGRTRELSDDVTNVQPTVPGRFLGHLLLGRDMIREAARAQGDVNPDLASLLEHIILSHLALPEWGSPRLPLIPECLIIHHADDLDAKLEMYVRCLMKDKETGPFTARDPVLGRQLYKGRTS